KTRNQYRARRIDVRAEERRAEEIWQEEECVEALVLLGDIFIEVFRVDAAASPRDLLIEGERESIRHPLLHLEKRADVARRDGEAAYRDRAILDDAGRK